MKRTCIPPIGIALTAWQSLWAQETGKTETIYSFEAPSGVVYPTVGPVIGQDDVIYGTTTSGSVYTLCGYFNCGAVYDLTRPSSPDGVWTESTLYIFTDPVLRIRS
jgi:hypothetical protein